MTSISVSTSPCGGWDADIFIQSVIIDIVFSWLVEVGTLISSILSILFEDKYQCLNRHFQKGWEFSGPWRYPKGCWSQKGEVVFTNPCIPICTSTHSIGGQIWAKILKFRLNLTCSSFGSLDAAGYEEAWWSEEVKVKVDVFSSEASHTTSNVSPSSIFLEKVISFPFCTQTQRVLKNTHSSFKSFKLLCD